MHLIPYYDGGCFDCVLDLALRNEYKEEVYARVNPRGDSLVETPGRHLVATLREVISLAYGHGVLGRFINGAYLIHGYT